ncbi:MAG: type IV pilus assembly protein PilM [Candidatus Moranbacteria bacterium]|nr:type IV pilus assembly protein PilM [Candidatus Moranbacteria bacterium]
MEQKLQSYFNNIASYFKKSKSHSIGIDLGGNNLKIVELQKKGGKIKLKNYALVKMEKDLSRRDLRYFSGQIVSKILADMSISKKDISIAIPSYSSLMTLLEVSGQSREEIESEIEYEASKYIPVDLSEVVFDWQIIESVSMLKKVGSNEKENLDQKTDSPALKKSKVLLISVMKNISSEFQKSFQDNNLSIESIEVDCFSIQRALLGKEKKNYLILDIGGKVTNIIGIYKGQILFNRNIDLAGVKITDLIAKSLNVGKERAEKLKINQGFEFDSEIVVKNILEPVFDSIIEEAQKNLKEFEEFKEESLDKIILSGGTAKVRGAKDYIQDKMKVEVVYGNPWSKVEYPKKIEKKILNNSPFFGVAVGLALIGLEE